MPFSVATAMGGDCGGGEPSLALRGLLGLLSFSVALEVSLMTSMPFAAICKAFDMGMAVNEISTGFSLI